MSGAPSADSPPVAAMPKTQRRVLGVLIEKAFTTPEYYPLTLKALTNGCNQKNNRAPVTEYSQEQVAEALDGLRELGLVGIVHTESGRTERFRHYMRQRFTFTEAQLAIFTELLLRGRQQLGELRTRASRMVPIETQEQLRDELQGLLQRGCVQADGPLDRRGAEVDHTWYCAGESPARAAWAPAAAEPPPPLPLRKPDAAAEPRGALHEARFLPQALEELRSENRQLRQELEQLRQLCAGLAAQVDQLRRDLGG